MNPASLYFVFDVPSEIVKLPADQYKQVVVATMQKTADDLLRSYPGLDQWQATVGTVDKEKAVLQCKGPYADKSHEVAQYGLDKWDFWSSLAVKSILGGNMMRIIGKITTAKEPVSVPEPGGELNSESCPGCGAMALRVRTKRLRALPPLLPEMIRVEMDCLQCRWTGSGDFPAKQFLL